jgi:hypothetical protein
MTDEDTPVNILVLTNDDFGGDGPSTGTITVTVPATNGTATVNDGGTPNDPTDDTVDYTPNADFNGTDMFTYEICDADGDCDQAVATIVVAPVNDLPVAEDDVATATEDMPTNIDPLPNDDFGGDGPGTGPITILTPPTNGTASVNDGGTPTDPTDDTIDYTPDPNYNGPDQIVYEICDTDGDCDPATIDITVDPVNDLPLADDDSETTDEDTPVNIIVLTNDDFGGDGPSTGTITVTVQPANGTATVNDGGTPTDPTDDTVDYTPDANYNGTDVFTYEICDGNGDCDDAVVDITINPVNELPTALDDVATTDEDVPVNIDPLVNDDFGGDGPSTGTITILGGAVDGTATVNDGGTPNDPSDDTIDYVPNPNFNGADAIFYEICDSNGDCDQATISITIDPVDDVPVAEDDVATATEDTPTNIDPLPNDDFGGDGPNTGPIFILTPPTNGTATVNDGGTPTDPTDDTIDYTPNPDYNGPDQIEYQICDLDGDCDPAVIDITVDPVNDLPVADDDSETTDEDTPVNVVVLTNDDFGGDGPSMGTITVTVPATNGTATVNDGGTPNDPTDDTVDYVPNANYNGTDQFTYEICDSNGDCDDAVVDITIDPVNDLPVADDDVVTATEDTPTNIDPLPNDDFGGDGPGTGPITILTPPTNGTASVNDGGTPTDPTDDTIDYTPNPDYNGPDQITYEICDANGDCDPATIDIAVDPVNDVPDAVDDPTEMTAEDTPVNIDVLTNDDFGGDGPSVGAITIVTPPTNGTAVVNDGGTPNDPTDDTVDYTPNADYNGPDAFDYEICDSDGDCDQATASITITPVNDLPDAQDDTANVPEDTPTNIDPLPNDGFGGDGPGTGPITILTPPTNGTATVNDGGTPNDPTDDTIDYTPNPDYNGPDQITYEICDANGDCDPATIDITVDPVNDLPVADDDSETTDEDTPVNILVLTNDDFGGDGPGTGTITVTIQPTNGTAVVNDGGTPNDPTDDTVDYTPDANYNGIDQFTYEICDSNGDCDDAVATITIDPVNDLPTALDDVASTDEDVPVNIDPLVNDDFGGDGPSTGTITILGGAVDGTATVNDGGTPNDPSDDTIDYVPNPNFNGADAIFYEICDSNGDCDQATISITIDPVDDVPVAEDDVATVTEDTPTNIDPLPNDDFGGDGPNTGPIFIVTPPTNGTATVNDGGTPIDPTDDTIDYTPNPDYNGPDQIEYQICDLDGDCDPAVIDITVDPVNDLPVADDDSETTDEDTPVNILVLTNDDFGGDGPSMGTITVTVPATNGTATVNDGGTPNDPTDDTVDYVPNANYNGTDQFTYEICDSNGDCDDAVVDITIDPVNDSPTANDDIATATEDTPTNIDPLPNDDFGGDGPGTGPITILTPPTNGTATVNDGGTPTDPTDDTIDYTPNPDYNGPDQITYEICDANGDCDPATIDITVDPVNDVPVADDDSETTDEDTPVNILVLTNDDFGGDGPSTGTITVLTQPTNGTAVVNDGGTPNDPTDDTVDYVPNANYNGTDQFTYEICDSNGDCDDAVVDITIDPVNDLPVAEDDVVTTNEDMPTNIDPLPNDDFGGDGPGTGPITILTPPTNGTATVNDGGTPDDPTDDTIDYTPNPDYNGPDQITYEICDANGDCDPATIDITVDPVNDLPVADDDSETTDEDTPVNIVVLTNDDFGGDGPGTGAITVTVQPTNGTATVNDGGTPNDPTDDTVDYVPDANYNGTDMFTYEICDSNGDCDDAVVTITIDPVNDVPTAVDDVASTDEDVPVNIDPLPNDDFGGDGPSTGTIAILGGASDGTATVNDGGTPNDPTDDTIDYVPNPDFNGQDDIFYEICDSNGDCDQATINITVDPVNDIPFAQDDVVILPEDVPAVIDPLPNDDFGGDGPGILPITILTPPTNGTATVNDGGTPNDPTDDTIDYTPDPDYNGPDQIVYEICDIDGDCAPATIDITVSPINDLPDAVDDPTEMTAEDTPVNIDVLVNDDFGGDGPSTGTITVTVQPTNGTAVVNDGGTPNDPTDDTVDYTPNADYNGPDSFDYEICDSNGDCDQATASIMITPVDDLPVADDDVATATEDTPLNIDPLPNDDFGGDGPAMGPITIVTPPTNGMATVNDGGTPNDPTDDTIDYTPGPDYNGPDQITYQICDSDGDCDQATIDVTVDPVNDLPDAVDDPTETTEEDTPVNIDVLTNDDFGGDGPSTGAITVTVQPTNGTAVVNDGGTPNDPTDDTVDYTPNADYNGPDSFDYEICDSNGDCDQATASITITPVNDLPDAQDDIANVPEDVPTNIDPLPNDDFGGDGPIMGPITIVTPPTNGTATVNDGGTPNDPTDDTIDYSPDPNYNGPDAIVYEICDVNGDCDQATININVDSANDLPDAVDDPTETTDEDTPVNIDVLANDDFGGDGPSMGAITVMVQPTNGTAVVNDGGTPNDPTDDTVDYTPAPDYNGTDMFTYEICDSNGDCDQAVATVTIGEVNDLPTAVDDVASTDEDVPVNIDPLPNDDFGGDGPSTGTITILGGASNGTATVNDGGTPNDPTDDTIDYTPDPNFNGSDAIFYEICDSNGDCDQATINITIDPVDDMPDAQDDVVTTDEDTPTNIDPLPNDDFGGDGPGILPVTILTPPTNGTATVNDGGTPNDPTDDTIDYTPNPDYNGTDQITYQICDSDADCEPATIDITVDPVNDLPVANDDTEVTDENTPVNVAVLTNDDFGGDGPSTGTITVLTQPANGTAVLNDGGTPNDPTDDTVDYTPNANYNGTDVFTYEICDSNGDCDDAVVTIIIDPALFVKLLPRMMLQGALLDSPDGLMRDDLRSADVIPLEEPYTVLEFAHFSGGGSETVATPLDIFSGHGDNSIVDWVFVELRDANDPALIVATRSGLLQRDGDVVEIDGVSPLCFTQTTSRQLLCSSTPP